MDLKRLVNNKQATIVDVRKENEFLAGHVKGSINIPLDKISEKAEELKQMKPLILCCLSGGRSGQATAYLESLGHTDVYNGGGWEMVDSYKDSSDN